MDATQMEISSTQIGQEAFEYILSGGIGLRQFMAENWETKPLYIERDNAQHFAQLKVSRQTIDEMLRNNSIEYTKNLDITMYENGVRQTFNPGKRDNDKKEAFLIQFRWHFAFFVPLDGRAYAASVWQYYNQGCSIRKCR